MELFHRFDSLPMWSVMLIVIVIITLSIEAGYAIGRQDLQRHEREARKINMSTVVGASLGLLAFILAFTFGAATSRFDDRRSLALVEVNAIGTAYLRAEVLPPAQSESSKDLLQYYVTDRFEALMSSDARILMQHRVTAESVQAELWSIAMVQAKEMPSPTVTFYLSALNDLIDVHQARYTIGAQHRMPPFMWGALLVLTILTMMLGGYDNGVSEAPRRSFINLGIALAFATVLILVVGLDRPAEGARYINKGPYLDLQKSMGIELAPAL